MWKTFAINLVWWPLCFKGILSSLQVLQCTLCLFSQQRQYYTQLLPLPWGKSLLAPTVLGTTWPAATRVIFEARERTLGTKLIWSLSACIVGPPSGGNSRYLNAYNRRAFNYIKNQRVKTWLLRICRAKIWDRFLFSKIYKKNCIHLDK